MPKGSGGGGRPGRSGGGGSPADAGQPGEVFRAADQAKKNEATLKEFDKNISSAQRAFDDARDRHADLISKFDRGKATKAEKDAALQEKKKWREVRDNLENAKAEFQKTLKK
jgi:predicted  nucleic acid-binding Zn-ribbon protein